MNILFINPSRAGKGNIPLNIPILMAIAKECGCKVRLFDFQDYPPFQPKDEGVKFGQFKPPENQGEIDRHLQQESGKGNFTCDHLRDDAPLSTLTSIIQSGWPDIIATTSLSADYRFISGVLKKIKTQYGGFYIIGGIHAILCTEEVAKDNLFDMICFGEGEKPLKNIISYKRGEISRQDIKGIWYRDTSEPYQKNPPEKLTDLPTLPDMNFEQFLPVHFYRPFDGRLYKMCNYEMSRGCPFQCSYCVNGTLANKYKGLGKYHRSKSVTQTIDELKGLIKRYNFEFIRFWDEDFTCIPTEQLEKLALQYKREISLPFLIYARVESVTEKKVQLLKNMGCVTFAMGIESGNQWIRKNVLFRNTSDETIIERFLLVKKYGIRTSAYNMIGLPFEEREKIFETIELNRSCQTTTSSVVFLEPYKHTPIHKICEKEGLIGPDYEPEYCFTRPHCIPEGMSENELVGLLRTFNLYIQLPKDDWPTIEYFEKNDPEGDPNLKDQFEALVKQSQ